jgi:hypothetical protein
MKSIKIPLAIILLVLFSQTANARIIYVPTDSSTIQKAIKGANNGDTVLVAPGHYHENISFWGKKILVASHFIQDGSRSTIDSTIIHGDTPTHPDTGSVVRFISGEDTNSVICGFTIRDGTGTKLQTPGYLMERGGGIVCFNASAKILNNIIANNVAYNGGGIFCWETRCIIRNNIIKYNEAPQYSANIGGGGIYITHATGVVIEGNVIDSNNNSFEYGYGGGILITFYSVSTVVLNNTIIRNSGSAGAGICVYSGSDIQIKNNIVFRNHNHVGIYCHPTGVTISFNDVWGNLAGNFQGGPPGLGDTSWGECCYYHTPCDSFHNIIVDPLFDPDSTNYFLLCNSPCIDAGDPSDPVPPGGGVWIDVGAVEYPYLCGDAYRDGIIDGSDFVFILNYLYVHGPAPCPLGRADVNRDHKVDGSDLVYLLNYLFVGGPPPVCGGNEPSLANPSSKLYHTLASAEISLSEPKFTKDRVGEITVAGKFDIELAAVQLEASYDPKQIELIEPALSPRCEGLQIYFSAANGQLKIGILDITGVHRIPAGEGPILTLKIKAKDLSSLKISKAILVDKNANSFLANVVEKFEEATLLPDKYCLHQNYPNPFNPETEISYDLPNDCWVKLSIYNISGQKVKTLVDGFEAAGHKTVIWDGRNEQDEQVASGVFFYRLEAGEFTATKKMVLLR